MVAQFNIFKPPDLIQFQVAADTAQCFTVSFLNSIRPYMKMILPPLEKGDRGGFSRWIPPKSPLAPLFQRGESSQF
jgi:hypothetical protein